MQRFQRTEQLSTTAYLQLLAAYEKANQVKQDKEKWQKQDNNKNAVISAMTYEMTKKIIKDYEEKLIYEIHDAIVALDDKDLNKHKPQLSDQEYLNALKFHEAAKTSLLKVNLALHQYKAACENFAGDRKKTPAFKEKLDQIAAPYKLLKKEAKDNTEKLIYNSQNAIKHLYGSKSGMFIESSPTVSSLSRSTLTTGSSATGTDSSLNNSSLTTGSSPTESGSGSRSSDEFQPALFKIRF